MVWNTAFGQDLVFTKWLKHFPKDCLWGLLLMVARWLAQSPHSKKVLWGLGTFCVEFACFPWECKGFLPQSRDMHLRCLDMGLDRNLVTANSNDSESLAGEGSWTPGRFNHTRYIKGKRADQISPWSTRLTAAPRGKVWVTEILTDKIIKFVKAYAH